MNATIGTFGKLPAAGDFVSYNAGSGVARHYQDWVQVEVDHLAQVGKVLGDDPIRFVFRDPGATGACVGTLRASRDRVGRKFPLTIFTEVDLVTAAQSYASIPAGYAQFLDESARILEEQLEHLDAQSLAASVDRLPLPSYESLTESHRWTHEALQATTGQTILEALFGPLEQGVQYHGLNMFVTACQQARAPEPSTASIILECPASDDVQLAFWLRLAEGLLQWRQAPPAFFWTDVRSPDSRLLLCLGAPATGVLQYLADPDAVADRLWPMRTTSQSAVDAGRAALGPHRLATLEPPAPTAAGLIEAFVHHP